MKDLTSLEKLVDAFSMLPSVGRKSAERFAYSILTMEKENVDQLINSLKEVKSKIHQCPKCGIFTEFDECDICKDNDRNSNQLIVVSYPKDIIKFESLNSFKGRYHVLNGVISPMKGIGPDDLSIDKLIDRIKKENVKEIILSTDPTIEGETTAMYIAKLLEKENVVVTRLGYGLPIGSHIDYVDSKTIEKALEGRKKL